MQEAHPHQEPLRRALVELHFLLIAVMLRDEDGRGRVCGGTHGHTGAAIAKRRETVGGWRGAEDWAWVAHLGRGPPTPCSWLSCKAAALPTGRRRGEMRPLRTLPLPRRVEAGIDWTARQSRRKETQLQGLTLSQAGGNSPCRPPSGAPGHTPRRGSRGATRRLVRTAPGVGACAEVQKFHFHFHYHHMFMIGIGPRRKRALRHRTAPGSVAARAVAQARTQR